MLHLLFGKMRFRFKLLAYTKCTGCLFTCWRWDFVDQVGLKLQFEKTTWRHWVFEFFSESSATSVGVITGLLGPLAVTLRIASLKKIFQAILTVIHRFSWKFFHFPSIVSLTCVIRYTMRFFYSGDPFMRDRFSRWKITPFWKSSKLIFLWDWFIQGLHQRYNWSMHFSCVQGPSLGLFTRFSFRFGFHFHVSFVLDCSKKCLAGVAVWRSVLLRSCLSNLFLGRWLP